MKPIGELCKEKVVYGAWCVFDGDMATDERAAWVRELGLDFIYYGIGGDHKKAIPALDMCARHGLGMLAFDPAVDGLPMDRFWTLKNAVKDYADHPALLGTVLRDEPGVYDLPRLKLLAKTYAEETGKTPGVNLFPSYASPLQFNYVDFKEYIRQFAEGLDVPYISYDHYPLYGMGDRTWVQRNYFSDFEIVSDACREYGRDMWFFIQTLGFNRIVREPNEADIRWQLYCALSFGARVIQLFTYGSPGDENGDTADETFELALLDRKGQKTVRYGYVQNIIREIGGFDGEYVKYRHVGAMLDKAGYRATESDEEVEITFPGKVIKRKIPNNYLELAHPLAKFGPIEAIRGERPVLAGCFERGEAKAFTLVNAADPGLRVGNCVSVSFAEPQTLRVWRHGLPETVAPDGAFRCELACGEGLFIEIL